MPSNFITSINGAASSSGCWRKTITTDITLTATDIGRRERVTKERNPYIGLRSIVILQQSTLLSLYNLLLSMLINLQPPLSAR